MMKPEELINLDAFDRLAAEAPDNEWREIRIYVRKNKDGKGAEVRFAQEVRIARVIEGNELQ